jgi:ABC-type transport system involved in multi-copper enzyme maturation permease subunit
LYNSYRHELFKAFKLKYFKLVLLIPPVTMLTIIVIQTLVKVLARPNVPLPRTLSTANSLYGLGSEGTIAFASSILTPLFGTYSLLLIIGCSLLISNEYRWNTIKTLATRQPDRLNLVLSKCLFALTFVIIGTVSFTVSWLVFGIYNKFFFDQPFSLTNADVQNIGAGFKYFALQGFLVLIYCLLAITLAFQFKSVVAGIIVYFIYSSIDGALSSLGAAASNRNMEAEGIFALLLDIVKAMNPFLLNSSYNRIAMQERVLPNFSANSTALVTNEQIIASNPVWWAWIMLFIYVAVFTWLAIYIFSSRDITD